MSAPSREVLDALRDIALFEDVDEATLKAWSLSMRLLTIEKSAVLVRQGDPGQVMYLVAKGWLRATVRTMAGRDVEISRLGPGDSVGEVQLVVGGVRSATVAAEERCELLEVSKADFELIGARLPKVMDRLRGTARRRLHRSLLVGVLSDWIGPMDPKIVGELEHVIEWITIPAGEVLFRQGDPGDSWYIAASGRIEAVVTDTAGTQRVVGEVGRGESVGEMALITGNPRTATLTALRDATLMKFPIAISDDILFRFPGVGMAINRVLVRRISLGQAASRPTPEGLLLALVPLSNAAPIDRALSASLAKLGSVTEVNRERLVQLGVLDAAAANDVSHPSWIRLSAWLEEERAHCSFVVLQADPTSSIWTRWVARQADQVVLVASAADDPAVTALETELFPKGADAGVRRTLLLLHSDGAKLPTGTAKWLARRTVDAHLHAALDRPADLDRVARTLTGRSIALALSGGGARGFAHIGVIRALQEAGISIDAVGGTSAGAAIAAQVAMGLTYDEMIALNAAIFALRPFRELTVPVFALLGTERVDRGLKGAYGEIQLEDLWIPMVAISANLTRSSLHVHERGPVWNAVRASSSLPGVAVPVVEDGQLLVDGGLLNNLPVDVLRTRGAGKVIASDVMGGDGEMAGTVFPSPWTSLARRVLPFVAPDSAPSIFDILTRSMLLASQAHARAAREGADLCLRPPVQRFNLLDVEAIAQIAQVGYDDAKARLAQNQVFRSMPVT